MEREKEKEKNKSESEWSTDTALVEELKERLDYAWRRRDAAYTSLMHIISAYTKWDSVKEREMLKKIWYVEDEREKEELAWAKNNIHLETNF